MLKGEGGKVGDPAWVRDGHEVTVIVDHDSVYFRLLCPEDGSCRPVDGGDECWLKSWADNESWEQFHAGDFADLSGAVLPVAIEHRLVRDGEGEPEWRFVL